ncbi:MAG: mechanosensitive ion channel [Methanocellales archaeon]|nr:mechanosensitive ion channel [Methanocellales archaeon]
MGIGSHWTLEIGVAYGSDINKVKDILLEITKEAPDVLNDPPPAVFFMEFADFSLKKKLVVTDYLNCRINERFEEEKTVE